MRRRRALMAASAFAALAMAAPVMAQAQATTADQIGEVVVTASRVNRSGFNAPTPTTVLNTADLQRRAPNNVSEVLNDLPTFRATTSPNTSSFGLTNSGQTYLDLRGIGSQRTLTLVNGRRFVPSSTAGQVDINVIPSSLIQNIEVVTGGASASWGSDAVAGVVNIILKKKFQGIEASAQYGISDRGDAKNYIFSGAAGTSFNEGRGQITIGGEYSNDHGIGPEGRLKRNDWIQDRAAVTNAGWATNGLPATIYANNVQFANQAPGGLITGPLPAVSNAGLLGTIFNANGTTSQLQYGQVFGTMMIGGSNTGVNFTSAQPYRAPVERWNVLARLDYKLSEQTNFNLEVSNAESTAKYDALPFKDGGSATATVPAGTPAGVLIARIDNPFLPASIRTRMQAASLTAVFIGRDGFGLNGSTPEALEHVYSNNHNVRAVVGLDGVLGLGTWKWDAYYQYGRNEVTEQRSGGNRIMANYRAATDVVTNPANGQPICRTTLTNPTNGCVPFNIFGLGSPSSSAIAYVTGVGTMNNVQTQHVVAVNFRGDLFKLPAGAISAAVGAEYRKESTNQVVDPISAAGGFEFTNLAALSGSYNVKELYGELIVPVLKDSPLGRELDLQLAGRITDYSTSGTVATWKAGLTWNLTESVRLRGAVSRDIRAGNMGELFAAQAATPFVPIDRVLNVPNPLTAVQAIARGNPKLDPERATTYTGGVVLQPEWVRGLRVSVDYYKINMTGQIARVAGQTIIDRCAQGLADYCALIFRNSDPNNRYITSVSNPFLNLNGFKSSGLDFEISYAHAAPKFIPWGGDFILRGLANYTHEFATRDALGTIDRAGQLGGAGVPHWQGNTTITYNLAKFSTSLQGRFVEGGNIDNTAKPGTATSANIYTVPARWFWNLSMSYDILRSAGRQLQVYGVVSNLFDSNPPFPFAPSSATVSPYYDGIGRAFRFGVRIRR